MYSKELNFKKNPELVMGECCRNYFLDVDFKVILPISKDSLATLFFLMIRGHFPERATVVNRRSETADTKNTINCSVFKRLRNIHL